MRIKKNGKILITRAFAESRSVCFLLEIFLFILWRLFYATTLTYGFNNSSLFRCDNFQLTSYRVPALIESARSGATSTLRNYWLVYILSSWKGSVQQSRRSFAIFESYFYSYFSHTVYKGRPAQPIALTSLFSYTSPRVFRDGWPSGHPNEYCPFPRRFFLSNLLQ